MFDMPEIKLNNFSIAQLQNTAYDLLNINLNYSPTLNFPFLDNIYRRETVKLSCRKLQSALELIKGNEYLSEVFASFRMSMEYRATDDALLCFSRELSELINIRRTEPGLTSEEILLADIPPLRSSELKYHDPENSCLERIASLFESNKDLFKIAFLDGSIGSNDYIPGWSDVDIFAMVSADALSSQDNFIRLGHVARQVKRELYSYHRLQVHPVFYTLETELYFRRYDRFPTVCLQRGRLLVAHESKLILFGAEAVQAEDAHIAYRNFCHDFIKLKHMKKKGVLTKVLLIHRLFLFPLSYLATKGIRCYKADSFDALPEYLPGFPSVHDFCKTLTDVYLSMEIKYSHRFVLRRLLMSVVDPLFTNKFSLLLERDQAMSITRLYDSMCGKGLFEQVEEYLFSGLAEMGD